METGKFGGISSLEGVHSIELVPEFDSPRVLNRLQTVLEDSRTLRAAVAFWTVRKEDVNEDLTRALSGNGFLCVDLQWPTDIEAVAGLKLAGADVWLHLARANAQRGEGKSHTQRHLLHTKILLFDLWGGGSELWVGSHNWTGRALSGLNIEASVVFRLSRESALYRDSERLLLQIKGACEAFNPELIDDYHGWQGDGGDGDDDGATERPVLMLRARDAAKLGGKVVSLFGKRDENYRDFMRVGEEVIVDVEDRDTKATSLYLASIRVAGLIEDAPVSHEEQLHAFAKGDRPLVLGPERPDSKLVDKARFWVSVMMSREAPKECRLADVETRKRWIPSPNDPLQKRLDLEARHLYRRPIRTLVSRPFRGEKIKGGEGASGLPEGAAERTSTSEETEVRLLRRRRVFGLPSGR